MNTLKLGIIGTGRIAQRFVKECEEVPYIAIAAVFNPHEGSAEAFVKQYLDRECITTDDLGVLWSAVDVIYVASPHATHYAYAKQALEQGKHVLCEKPMCLSGDQAVELYRIARERRRILMEAIKTAYCPGFQGILKLVESGKIGAVCDVEACFTRLGNSALREVWDVESGGSYTEFGTYTLLPIAKLLGTESKDIQFWSLPAQTGVDSYTRTTITYDHANATAKTGLGIKSEGQLVISGTNGYILVPSPWWLTKHVEVHYENPNKVECYEYPYEGSGLRYEITSFVKKVLALEEMRRKYAGEDDEILFTIWGYLEQIDGVSPEESIWFACQMEAFHMQRDMLCEQVQNIELAVKVWAHRGCCMRYPENTLVAFEAAAKLDGLTGIELDVQMTKDGELVVIHDEKVDRTTTGIGYVRDYTLAELKNLQITGSGQQEKYVSESGSDITIPTLREVFELLAPYCKEKGLLINIELKNSIVRYEGMEQKVVDMVDSFGLQSYIIYSSFLPESMGMLKSMDSSLQTAILAVNIHDCIRDAKKYNADAIHPGVTGLDINRNMQIELGKDVKAVRAWNAQEPFYGQGNKVPEKDLRDYKVFGVTDIFTNVPERYL